MAAGAAIAAGTQAYANPIRFENPGGPAYFQWFGPAVSNVYLDITQPQGNQTGLNNSLASEFRQSNQSGFTFVRGSLTSTTAVQITPDTFIAPVAGGSLIPDPVLLWRDLGGYAYYAPYGSGLPGSQPTYIGLRFNPGDGNHYGWIGVVRNGADLDAFAWGYETDPGVPIAAGVPEPGSLALLAFGAAGLAATRRRRGSAR